MARPLPSQTHDKALARRMLRGDEHAFEEFFKRYFPSLYRFALTRMDQEASDAEEIVQATLCKAITKIYTYRGEATLFTWLCTFCRHEISAFYRKRRRQPPVLALVEDSPEISAALASLAAFGEDTPEESFHRKEISRLVQTTLDLLPGRYGDSLEWKYIEGLSVRDIATRLGVGSKAAESVLTRARQAFRDGFMAMSQEVSRSPLPLKKAPV